MQLRRLAGLSTLRPPTPFEQAMQHGRWLQWRTRRTWPRPLPTAPFSMPLPMMQPGSRRGSGLPRSTWSRRATGWRSRKWSRWAGSRDPAAAGSLPGAMPLRACCRGFQSATAHRWRCNPPRARTQLGVCGVECKTVEKAADRVMGEHDTDVAEALFVVSRRQRGCGGGPVGCLGDCRLRGLRLCGEGCTMQAGLRGVGRSRQTLRGMHRCLNPRWLCLRCRLQGKRDQVSFARWLCHELTAACTSPPPPLPQVRCWPCGRGA